MPEPEKLSVWNQIVDALALKTSDRVPLLQVDPESVDPITGGPGGNDMTVPLDVLGRALLVMGGALLAENNLSDLLDISEARNNLLLGPLATMFFGQAITGTMDETTSLHGDGTWKPGSGLGAGLLFELSGAVIPIAETASPHIPILANGVLNDVMVTLDTPPGVGEQCELDVFVNANNAGPVSIFPTGPKPIMGEGALIGHLALPAPVPVTAFQDYVSCAVTNPAGRGLVVVVG